MDDTNTLRTAAQADLISKVIRFGALRQAFADLPDGGSYTEARDTLVDGDKLLAEIKAGIAALAQPEPAPTPAAQVQPMIPLSAIRPIAVEAIRAVMNCPDVRGEDGKYLVDTLEEVAAAAAELLAKPFESEGNRRTPPVALPAVVDAEAVAWQERQTVARGQWSDWYACKGHPTTEPFSRTVDGITYEWRPLYAAPIKAEATKVALWQYRWTNPGDYTHQSEDALAWKEVDPRSLQTLESRLDELRSYKSGGKPCYEVRALGVIDPAPASASEPEQPEWQHLKQYGYAPGNYLAKCHSCGKVAEFIDKRAVCCRPCAEAKHAAASGASTEVQAPIPQAAKLAMIEHPMLLTWGEELAKAIEDNHVISGGNGPNWIAGWETANSCSADLVRLRVSQLAHGIASPSGAEGGERE